MDYLSTRAKKVAVVERWPVVEVRLSFCECSLIAIDKCIYICTCHTAYV